MHDNQNFHWLYGIEEYAEKNNLSATFQSLLKSAIETVFRGNTDHLGKLLAHEETCDLPGRGLRMQAITEYWLSTGSNLALITLLASFDSDQFIDALYDWINSNPDVDVNDMLSRGQIQSKLWLLEYLKKVTGTQSLGHVVQYGGWNGQLLWLIDQRFSVRSLTNFEIDADALQQSQSMLDQCINTSCTKNKLYDVSKLEWDGKNRLIFNDTILPANTVINTSCEHMDNSWYDRLPVGQFFVYQTNNFFECDQHVNCVATLEEAIAKYPMTSTGYVGALETEKYTRFMGIGIK